MPRALVAIGSNLGDRQENASQALARLASLPRTEVKIVSPWRETQPVGGPGGQGPFLNGVAVLETNLEPLELLGELERIESDLGRVRHERWGARAVDLDLLLYDQQVIELPSLEVPHPRMAWRRFVLEAAADVAADMPHPTLGRTIGQLLTHLNTAHSYVALLGTPESGRSELAARVATAIGGRFLADPAGQVPLRGARDPAGYEYDRQIQFLDRRVDLVAVDRWPAGGSLAVSDFYAPEGLAQAKLALSPVEWERFRVQAEDKLSGIVKPKLIVAIDLPQRVESVPSAPDLRHELARLVAQRAPSPVLYLPATSRDVQVEEVRAAIESFA